MYDYRTSQYLRFHWCQCKSDAHSPECAMRIAGILGRNGKKFEGFFPRLVQLAGMRPGALRRLIALLITLQVAQTEGNQRIRGV